jgi:hypothetical protein
LALFAGLVGLVASSSCGPQQKFCADAGDGICRPPPDAAPDLGMEAPEDVGCPNGTSVLADGTVICNP